MSAELCLLIVASSLYLLAWFPASLAKGQTMGTKWLASNRNAPAKLDGWGARSERAYQNLKDYFPGFIVGVFAVEVTASHSSLTLAACWAYLVFRILHFSFYTAGIVPLRAATWTLSLVANFALFWAVIT